MGGAIETTGSVKTPEKAVLTGRTTGWAAHADRLRIVMRDYGARPARRPLEASFRGLALGDLALAARKAQEALALDPQCAVAWRLLALAHEGRGELSASLDAYQQAFTLKPNSHDILADLGRMALALGMEEIAAELFAKALAAEPGSAHLAEKLSAALIDGHQYPKAVEVLRNAIRADQTNAFLWNALGVVLLQQGDTTNALILIQHALQLSPGWTEALFNRARAKLDLGDLKGAIEDCDEALPQAGASQKPALLFVRAQARLAGGDLAGGWADYRARLAPKFAKAPIFHCPGRPWTATDEFKSKRVLVMGEQGLGDEIMFAGMMADLVSAMSPEGRLSLAAAPRLVALFQRSFPSIAVHPHKTEVDAGRPTITASLEVGEVDLWAPMGALTRRFRPTLERFQPSRPYLVPDAARKAAFRARLAQNPCLKVGVAWKSMKTYGARLKQYAPFEDWITLLGVPGVQFVNLQYGDCAAERAEARSWGVDLWTAPDLDLTDDIDGAAALSASMDLMIGVGNASTNLAAAVGVETWFLTPKVAWPSLGTPTYPWFHQTRVFAAERFGDWGPVMTRLAEALSKIAAASKPPPP